MSEFRYRQLNTAAVCLDSLTLETRQLLLKQLQVYNIQSQTESSAFPSFILQINSGIRGSWFNSVSAATVKLFPKEAGIPISPSSPTPQALKAASN